jgi:hypothetical protein
LLFKQGLGNYEEWNPMTALEQVIALVENLNPHW